MKYTVRSFSIGLLTTALIMLAVYYFLGDAAKNQANLETDEMISHIEQEGYRVLTEKEYISYSVANANQNETESEEQTSKEEAPEEETASAKDTDKKADKKKEKKNTEEKEKAEKGKDKKEKADNKPKSVTINIASGMASSQISSLLQENKLIDNAKEFTAYLEDNDYSLRVQLGKHTLKQGMSFYEIAEALTN